MRPNMMQAERLLKLDNELERGAGGNVEAGLGRASPRIGPSPRFWGRPRRDRSLAAGLGSPPRLPSQHRPRQPQWPALSHTGRLSNRPFSHSPSDAMLYKEHCMTMTQALDSQLQQFCRQRVAQIPEIVTSEGYLTPPAARPFLPSKQRNAHSLFASQSQPRTINHSHRLTPSCTRASRPSPRSR